MRTSSTLGHHRDVIEGMMCASEPFGEVETFINEAPLLDQDEKAALWLLAWSHARRKAFSGGKRGPCSVRSPGARGRSNQRGLRQAPKRPL